MHHDRSPRTPPRQQARGSRSPEPHGRHPRLPPVEEEAPSDMDTESLAPQILVPQVEYTRMTWAEQMPHFLQRWANTGMVMVMVI